MQYNIILKILNSFENIKKNFYKVIEHLYCFLLADCTRVGKNRFITHVLLLLFSC